MSCLDFFGVDAAIGYGIPASPFVQATAGDLYKRLEGLLTHTLVRLGTAPNMSADLANTWLREQLAPYTGHLIPVDFLTPQVGSRGLQQMLADGSLRAAWINLQVTPGWWCAEEVWNVLEASRIPILFPYSSLDWQQLDRILTAWPALPAIVCDLPRIGNNAVHAAMLRRHPQLYYTFSTLYSVYGGYQALVREFGATRFVFGTAYPLSEPGAAVTGLLYAGLTQNELEMIAVGNIQRLLMEVKR
ncbi:MAG: amidohydrolase family protein [Lentisphaeria bacterium]